VGNQRMGRIPASAVHVFLVVSASMAGLWMPGQAAADSGGAAAQISAATSLAQQMTASAEKTGGAALAGAEDTAQRAISQAQATDAQALQGAEQTTAAALDQTQSTISSGSASSSNGSGSSSSAGSAGSESGSGPGPASGSSGTDSPPATVPTSLSEATEDGDIPPALQTAVATAVSGQALPAAAAAARSDAWRGEATSVRHVSAPLSEDHRRASSATWPRDRQTPPRAAAHLGAAGSSGWLQMPLRHATGGDITALLGTSVHTSSSRSAERRAPMTRSEDSTYVAPPPPEWLGPASGGSAAAAAAGGGAGSSAGVLVGAVIAFLLILTSGRLSLDLAPLRSKPAALPLERPG